jgi:hypothetical protein
MDQAWKAISDKWDIVMMAPVAFLAALGLGLSVGWIGAKLLYNQRLVEHQDLIANLRAVLEDKLPPSVLRKIPRKRSKAMSFGFLLILIGLICASVGAIIVFGSTVSPKADEKTNPQAAAPPAPALIPATPHAPAISPPSEVREFTNRTPSELMTLYEGRTPFQAETLIQPYKGKWIKAQGKVINLLADSSEPGASIAVLKEGNAVIECRLNATWKDKVARLSNGDTLHVQGRINPFQNGSQLYLQQCEVI